MAVDVDDAEAAIAEAYLPVRIKPTPGKDLRMRLAARTFDRITVGQLEFRTAVGMATAAPVNYHVDIPLAGRSRSRAGASGETFTEPGSAAVFMPGEPVALDWTAGTRQLCLMFAEDEIEAELGRLLGRDIDKPVVFDPKMDLHSTAGQTWLRSLKLIGRDIAHDDGLLRYSLIARRMEQIIVGGLLVGHVHNYSGLFASGTATASSRAARRCVELMQERPEHHWTVGDLASEVAISARSLYGAFRDLTGVTPMAYLRRLRLQHAHDQLVDGDPQQMTVSHVAHSWGFAHLSRFAAAYRAVYGELPSTTLRRAR